MDINDWIGYKLICIMSKGLKNEPSYNETEFEVVISEDSNEEHGYKAVISGYDNENQSFSDDWDAKMVTDNLLWGNWEIKRKVKI
ncbi:hypothetical protein [Bacillus sp. REN10]|uniref:hypothetical protein n=1 Tax=Bacillus sp. REN10 TaxID=2782541 RepID=UPI00193C17AE|nr:hypothetical protein [Bacillus sp. REN10]